MGHWLLILIPHSLTPSSPSSPSSPHLPTPHSLPVLNFPTKLSIPNYVYIRCCRSH
ncbi:MAG: hypothetical protein RMY29_012665 [Nostoc sp. CreGUA01]|nr:hypothetical protein [Nostoc sp. CreGUA01]